MKILKLFRQLGPGLLFAGAAVGVSHLVQSTRAGAGYGFELIWILIIANVLKYPFMEFAPRYATATGKSLIDGYRKIGKWALILYAVLTLLTMFTIQAAVTIVTTGLVMSIFNIQVHPSIVTAIILGVSMLVLGLGHYKALDKIIKIVIVMLAISTIVAVSYAFGLGFFDPSSLSGNFDWANRIDILFLIAFVGWMPAPIDVSVWHSLWSTAKEDQLGKRPSIKESLTDFNIGYIGAAVLGIGFLSLGALVMFGSGEELSPKGVIFAEQLISMYTASIGSWAYPLIAIAALATMFSTTITCLDAYPRVLRRSTEILIPETRNMDKFERKLYWFWLIVVVIGSLLLLGYFSGSMGFMVDLATTISFVTAPVLAILNYRAITDKHVPEHARPKTWLKNYARVGIVFLSAFSIFYVVWKIFL